MTGTSVMKEFSAGREKSHKRAGRSSKCINNTNAKIIIQTFFTFNSKD